MLFQLNVNAKYVSNNTQPFDLSDEISVVFIIRDKSLYYAIYAQYPLAVLNRRGFSNGTQCVSLCDCRSSVFSFSRYLELPLLFQLRIWNPTFIGFVSQKQFRKSWYLIIWSQEGLKCLTSDLSISLTSRLGVIVIGAPKNVGL